MDEVARRGANKEATTDTDDNARANDSVSPHKPQKRALSNRLPMVTDQHVHHRKAVHIRQVASSSCAEECHPVRLQVNIVIGEADDERFDRSRLSKQIGEVA